MQYPVLKADEQTIDAIRKASSLENDYSFASFENEKAWNGYLDEPAETSTTVGLQLEGQFVPMMSGNNFYCTTWLPSQGQNAPDDFAGYAIDGQIHCRSAWFRPISASYAIEACFAYTSEGWVGSGTYGSDQDFRHSWMIATDTFHKSGGGVYYEPICYLLSGFDGYHIIPQRWGTSIELKGVWT